MLVSYLVDENGAESNWLIRDVNGSKRFQRGSGRTR